jgi:hypothetical protein
MSYHLVVLTALTLVLPGRAPAPPLKPKPTPQQVREVKSLCEEAQQDKEQLCKRLQSLQQAARDAQEKGAGLCRRLAILRAGPPLVEAAHRRAVERDRRFTSLVWRFQTTPNISLYRYRFKEAHDYLKQIRSRAYVDLYREFFLHRWPWERDRKQRTLNQHLFYGLIALGGWQDDHGKLLRGLSRFHLHVAPWLPKPGLLDVFCLPLP